MSTQDLQRDLQRLAALHREQAEVFDRVAANLVDALACVAAPRPVVTMEKHETEFLTAPEFAALLRVDQRTLRALRHAGDVPTPIMIGTRPRWRREDVDKWVAKRGVS